jgi:hypothetical protein
MSTQVSEHLISPSLGQSLKPQSAKQLERDYAKVAHTIATVGWRAAIRARTLASATGGIIQTKYRAFTRAFKESVTLVVVARFLAIHLKKKRDDKKETFG